MPRNRYEYEAGRYKKRDERKLSSEQSEETRCTATQSSLPTRSDAELRFGPQ